MTLLSQTLLETKEQKWGAKLDYTGVNFKWGKRVKLIEKAIKIVQRVRTLTNSKFQKPYLSFAHVKFIYISEALDDSLSGLFSNILFCAAVLCVSFFKSYIIHSFIRLVVGYFSIPSTGWLMEVCK